MEIARAGGFPPPRFSCREDSVMADKFVFRANVLVEETDLERKAREGGLKRLKFSESEKKEKEQEEKRRAKKLSEYSVQLSAEAATAIPPRPQSQEPLKDDDSQPTQEESSLRQILRPPEMRNTVSAPAILLQPALTGKSKSKNLFAKIRKFASRKVAVLAGKKTTSPTYTQSPSLKKGSVSLSQKTVSKANTPDKPGEAKKSVRTLNNPNERAAHSVSPPQRNSKQQPVSITEHSMRQKRTCELRRLSAESVKNSAEDIHERSPVKKASAGSKDTEQITQKSTQKSSHKANKRKSKPVRSKSSPAKLRKRVKHTKAAGIMRRILRRHKSMPSVSAPTR
ncbi:hypothetical protein OESDEN_05997 [Oesophagostomum dentatum]|uniref:Uncharacterized protein n=1 Tax=Oesophagostomum dentatum TaxID=61180 RepID=A0A0B1TE35_OESDE|nr:hypothetical protein OESDEN_05997 [Oesophagostomum dentatum]